MLRKWVASFTKRSYSLRFTVLAIFISISIIVTFMIMAVRYFVLVDEITYTASKLMANVSNEILHEFNAKLSAIENQAQLSEKLLTTKVIKLTETELIPYTYYLVHALPLLRAAHWEDPEGNLVYSKRENDGTITTEIHDKRVKPHQHIILNHDLNNRITKRFINEDLDFDQRLHASYNQAKKHKKMMWTDVYRFYTNNHLGISYVVPVYEQGILKGIFGFDVSLDFLKKYMSMQHVSQNGFAFIINGDENLIAYPDQYPFNVLPSEAEELINVHSLTLPLIDAGIDYFKKTHESEFILNHQGQEYMTTYQMIPELADKRWMVGVVAPQNDFTRFLHKANVITFMISLLLLALGIILISMVISRVVKPIHKLIEETDHIKDFELNTPVNIKSRIKEIIILHRAIISMKKGLMHFQKYVPKLLVKQLIQSGQDLEIGGERRDIVVFFSDIENFTSITEKMDPNELMWQLCEYFNVTTDIILEEMGTIDKYIGDGIMAFWGAPLMINEPCYHAAKAALICQEKIKDLNDHWHKEGKSIFKTRIGIHEGEAIVGNLGSSERLSYTALGDTVNLASRLEGINKEYHTQIVVSEAVYEKIKTQFSFRQLGSVTLKGRSHHIMIYELLGFIDSH